MITDRKRNSGQWRIAGFLGNEGGQSLIMALAIMFLLIFIGGIFITMVVRNTGSAKRSREVMSADYLAEAGVKYADDQLTYSEKGADWRPTPEYPEVITRLSAGDTPETIETALNTPDRPNTKDPDYYWLMRGFCRFSHGGGRFLLKVSYDPTPLDSENPQADPMSKYIRIESIGRMGVIDEKDPTTWTSRPERERATLVAYKAIGLTDYGRFITNKDRTEQNLTLGAPGFTTNFGVFSGNAGNDNIINNGEAYGGSIRVNGNLMWYGQDYVWLDDQHGEGVDVAGDIRHDSHTADADASAETGRVYVNRSMAYESDATDGSGNTLFDSAPYDSGGNSKLVGLYRDGRTSADRQGRPRHVTRLEPPLIDVTGPGGGLTRYRQLTRNSGEWKQDSEGNWYNTGYYGWGNGVYIDNRADSQGESELTTLPYEWTHPGTNNWVGPYYNPPGIIIELTDKDLNNDGEPDMIITHENKSGAKFVWYDADGNVVAPQGEVMYMPYPRNGVIFAEGNVRIRGTLPPPPSSDQNYSPQLTVVSAHTIYVEGNILKARWADEAHTVKLTDGEQQRSAIALLATEYVCVNTTRFFSPVNEVLMAGSDGEQFEVTTARSFWMNYACSSDPSSGYKLSNGDPAPLKLYLRHTSSGETGASYLNLLVNYPPKQGDEEYYSLYDFKYAGVTDKSSIITSPTDYTYALGDAAASQKDPGWECAVFPLYSPDSAGDLNYDYNTDPGAYNLIGFQLDQSVNTGIGQVNYLLSRAAVMPSDIRIEALMYAQERSFFVIPGEWFNPDPNDTIFEYAEAEDTRPLGVDNEYPFYGQPIDVKVTIYGAVSENVPASIADTSDWMSKWGWIPAVHGSANLDDYPGADTRGYRTPLVDGETDTNDKMAGLTFIYDQQLAYPLYQTSGGVVTPRADLYGRTLPLVPCLPVSPQTTYVGNPT